MTPSWEWYHQPFNAEILATNCYTQNSKIPFKEILPFFSQIHKVDVEMASPVVWNHPSNIIGFGPKQTPFLIAGTTFFRTVVTADTATWVLLIFPYLAKTKTNYLNYISLAKIPSFYVALSPAALTRNSKNTLKLNIHFLAKS